MPVDRTLLPPLPGKPEWYLEEGAYAARPAPEVSATEPAEVSFEPALQAPVVTTYRTERTTVVGPAEPRPTGRGRFLALAGRKRG